MLGKRYSAKVKTMMQSLDQDYPDRDFFVA